MILTDEIKEPRDLTYTDQPQSSTSGRPLTYSVKKNRIYVYHCTVCRHHIITCFC